MAQPFNLTAQINLRGPTNTRAIASQIRKQLSGIKVKVNLDVKGAEAKNIANINKQIKALSANAKTASKDVANLTTRVRELGAGLSGMGAAPAATALEKVKQQATTTGKEISVASSQIQEFGKQSGLAIRRFAAFSAVTGVVYSLTNAINSAYKEFVQFDKEVVRLSQVTGNSVSSLSDITKEITRLSTTLGVASNELITVSVTLAQAGLSAQDTKTALEALAKSALAPTFSDLNSTVEGSIALMRQFGISAEDLEDSLGSINAVAAAFAVEAGDIIAAIQRTGGVFASASNGVSQGKDALNEFIAVFTSVRATTREGAETIATGLRTIFTRIQRGSTIDALKEFGITLTDVEGKFVGPFEAIRRLSEGLSGLDPRDLRFGQIVEELGGFRQIGKVIPLIQQFSTAQQALAVAQGGQSSLAKNAVQAQQSLAVQFEKTRQSFVALIRDIGNSTTFRGIAKVALTTANAFITLASALKPLLPLLTALTAIKGASILSEFGSGFLGGLGKKGGGGGGPLGFATGGRVPGQGNRDTVAAMLTPGEYVIRKKAVEKIGVENLEQLNRGGRIKGYARGGRIEKIQAHDAYDGDSWHVSYIPESSPVGPMTSRGEGYDAYEIKKGLAWERALGQRATEIAQGAFTDSRKMSIDHSLGKALTQGQSIGGRPVHSVPNSIVNQMVAEGVAIRTSNKDNVATGKVQSEKVKATQLKTLESMGNKKLVYDRERSKLASGGMVQKFAGGGGVKQGEQFGGVGIFDSDMIGAGSKDVLNAILSSGKAYDVISGPAGSGKTTFATQRFGKNFVLSADDLDKFKEFIVLSSAGETKSGDFSPQAQGIMSGARQITALRIPAEKITQQRQQRLDNALRSGSQDKRSTKQLQGTINAPTSIPQNLYDQFSNVEFLEQFASGGLVQRFDDGGDVGGIKVAKTGKINKSDIERLTEKQAAALLENPNVQKNLFTVSQLQKRIQQRQAVAKEEQELVGAQEYGLVGLYGSPRDVAAKTADGSTVKIIGKTLDKKLSDEYEKMMVDGFEQTVSAVGNNMASRVGASATSLDKNQMEKAGLYNAIGAYLEAAIATLGAPYDKNETNDPIDFAGGLGDAAALFGIPSNIPTDTTRTVFGKGKSPNDFLGQINRFKGFAQGGSAEDTVPALLTPGEYVINKKAAKAIGMQKLNKLNKADRIQGFNKGGAVGYVQKFADGGSVKDDRLAYLERIAEKLGVTVGQYETAVRADIMKRAEKISTDKIGAQTDLTDLIVKNTGNIDAESVQAEFKEKAKEAIAVIYDGIENIDTDMLEASLEDIVNMMQQGLSVSEIKEASEGLREVLDAEITARGELVTAEEQMTKELGFLTSRMKVRDIDVRAQRSVEQGKFGALDKLDLRQAQKSIETPLGKMFDDFGEMMSTRNLPGMKMLERSFPKVAGKLTAFGDKMGGITGIIGTGSTLLASKMPDLANSFDYLLGTVSETSEGLAGFTGALEKGGSLGLSGAVLGQQMFGRRGAAVGGTAGLAAGAVTGFIDASVAKETENAFRGVTEASNELNKSMDELSNARTVQERQMLEKEAVKNYNALNKSLQDSAKTIEGNRGWKAFSAGLQGATQALITMASTAAAFGMSGGAGGFGFGGGRRRKPRRLRRAIGGRVGYNDGSLVPVNLAPGEGVLSPEMASQFSNVELQRLNNADRKGYGADASMLNGTPMGIVPGKGSGKVDNFKTNLAAGSYVIRSASMDALYAAHGGRIGRSVVSGRGYAVGGRIKREGHNPGLLVAGKVALEAAAILSFVIPAIASFFDPELQKQQLQAEISSLEQLKRLTDISAAQSTQNRRYSERIIRASDPVEARDATGQFVMSEEERQRAYGQLRTDDGRLNVLNKLGEQQARASLSAQGIMVPDSVSVQEFLDKLKDTGDIDGYNKSLRLISKSHDELRKRIYLEARVREGATVIEAEKEFRGGGASVETKIEEEFFRENRPDVLADRLEVINRSINHFALNLKDVMDRVAASMQRVTRESGELFARLDQFTAGMTGPGATAGPARTGTADVLRNIQGYSADELDTAVSGIELAMGNTEQVQDMGDLVRGMQLIQNELPMILRNAGGQDLEAGSTQAIDESLAKMFEGVDLGEGVEKRLRESIMDVIQDKTGSATTQPMSFEELADQVPGLKELNATAEQARATMLQYAEAQMETINRLGQASDRMSALMIQAAQLGVRANQVQLEAALDLKKQFNETISLEELRAPFQAELNGLLAVANGRPNMTPAAIADAIRDRQSQLSEISEDPNRQMTELENLEVARLTKEINAYQRALDKLANSTDLANAAMQKIQEQERISQGRRQGVMDYLGMVNDPEAMLGFIREQTAYTNVMGADQPGGAASLNDVVTGLRALDLVEATSTPEEFQQILQKFVQNALGVVEGAAGPQAEFVKKLLAAVEKDFAVGADARAELDPELKAAIDAYKEAVAQQQQALEAQQGLIKDSADITGRVIRESAQEFNKTIVQAAKNAAAEIDAAAERLGLQDVQPIEAGEAADAAAMRELEAAALDAAAALRGLNQDSERLPEETRRRNEALPKPLQNPSPRSTLPTPKTDLKTGVQEFRSKGGMIYASKGTLVNFEPKGTDTVPAMLTPGEFVVNRAATQKNLGLLKAINSGKASSQGDVVTYASVGGMISTPRYFASGGETRKDIEDRIAKERQEEQAIIARRQKRAEDYQNSDEYIQDILRLKEKHRERALLDAKSLLASSAKRYASGELDIAGVVDFAAKRNFEADLYEDALTPGAEREWGVDKERDEKLYREPLRSPINQELQKLKANPEDYANRYRDYSSQEGDLYDESIDMSKEISRKKAGYLPDRSEMSRQRQIRFNRNEILYYEPYSDRAKLRDLDIVSGKTDSVFDRYVYRRSLKKALMANGANEEMADIHLDRNGLASPEIEKIMEKPGFDKQADSYSNISKRELLDEARARLLEANVTIPKKAATARENRQDIEARLARQAEEKEYIRDEQRRRSDAYENSDKEKEDIAQMIAQSKKLALQNTKLLMADYADDIASGTKGIQDILNWAGSDYFSLLDNANILSKTGDEDFRNWGDPKYKDKNKEYMELFRSPIQQELQQLKADPEAYASRSEALDTQRDKLDKMYSSLNDTMASRSLGYLPGNVDEDRSYDIFSNTIDRLNNLYMDYNDKTKLLDLDLVSGITDSARIQGFIRARAIQKALMANGITENEIKSKSPSDVDKVEKAKRQPSFDQQVDSLLNKSKKELQNEARERLTKANVDISTNKIQPPVIPQQAAGQQPTIPQMPQQAAGQQPTIPQMPQQAAGQQARQRAEVDQQINQDRKPIAIPAAALRNREARKQYYADKREQATNKRQSIRQSRYEKYALRYGPEKAAEIMQKQGFNIVNGRVAQAPREERQQQQQQRMSVIDRYVKQYNTSGTQLDPLTWANRNLPGLTDSRLEAFIQKFGITMDEARTKATPVEQYTTVGGDTREKITASTGLSDKPGSYREMQKESFLKSIMEKEGVTRWQAGNVYDQRQTQAIKNYKGTLPNYLDRLRKDLAEYVQSQLTSPEPNSVKFSNTTLDTDAFMGSYSLLADQVKDRLVESFPYRQPQSYRGLLPNQKKFNPSIDFKEVFPDGLAYLPDDMYQGYISQTSGMGRFIKQKVIERLLDLQEKSERTEMESRVGIAKGKLPIAEAFLMGAFDKEIAAREQVIADRIALIETQNKIIQNREEARDITEQLGRAKIDIEEYKIARTQEKIGLSKGILSDIDRQIATIEKQIALHNLNKPGGITAPIATGFNNGGVVYASKGTLVNYQPRGTDTVPAMLTPGEFVVNRSATQKNLGLLKAINSGSNVSNNGGVSYASRGGIMQARGYQSGGSVVGNMLQSFMSGTDSIGNIFNTFVKEFRTETNNFGDLINNLARVFPALNTPINIFGNHISDFSRAINSLKNIEIKGPNIPSTIKVNSDTIRVELIAPTDNNYKLSDEDKQKITSQLEERLKGLITLGR
jgi:TP901 family phage tail tape measure protein